MYIQNVLIGFDVFEQERVKLLCMHNNHQEKKGPGIGGGG